MPQGFDNLYPLFIHQGLLIIAPILNCNLGSKDILVCFAIELPAWCIECFFGSRIGIYITSLQIFDPRQSREMLHEPRKTLLTLPQSLFRLLALRDVKGEDNSLSNRIEQRRLL